MEIEGLMSIGVREHADGVGRDLHISFAPEFRGLGLAEQGTQFRGYCRTLREQIGGIDDDTDRTRQGMLVVLQVAEQLLPYIEAGEITLEDPIVVEMAPQHSESGGGPLSIMDLLNERGGGGGT